MDEEIERLLRELVVETIRKVGGKYVLYSKSKKNGKRKRLGTHSSRASAERQERAIQMRKHGG